MMNSNRVLFQNTNASNNNGRGVATPPQPPRINSLMSRMLATNIDAANQTLTENNNNNNINIKRNLFGIRLNHDQLKDDLKEMWREQVERQKVKWNFDFETLKPLADTTNQKKALNVINNNNNNSENNKTSNFKWTKVKTLDINGQENAANINITKVANAKSTKVVLGPSAKSTMSSCEYAKTSLDQRELKIARQRIMPRNSKNFNIFNDFKQQAKSINDIENGEEEEEEEEEDEALAVPQFYKQQRRLKLNEEKTRIDYMSLLMVPQQQQQQQQQQQRLSLSPITKPKSPKIKTASPLNSSKTFEPIFKFKSTTKSPNNKTLTTTTTTSSPPKDTVVIQRPKPIKRTHANQLTSPSTQNLIITFSENRKDTLRSAVQQQQQTNKKVLAPPASNHHQIVQKRTQKILKPKRTRQQIKASTMSAFTSTAASVAITRGASALKTCLNDKMKQQSLLDLFKQRKRRNSLSNECTTAMTTQAIMDKKMSNKNLVEDLAASSSSSSHFLRSSAAVLASN
jgi:hypothetical protein